MKKLLFAITIGFALLGNSAYAADYTIKMVTHTDKGTYAFEPSQLTIKAGDKVTWINNQDDTHNVMSESVPKGAQPFESPMLEKKGQQWSYTFKQSGTYRFHCHPHADSGMRGEIIVDHPSPVEEQASGHPHEAGDHHAAAESKPSDDASAKSQQLTEQQAMQLLQEGKPVYSCPMHQHVFSDKEGKCPICGMDMRQASAVQDGKAVFGQKSPMPNMMEKK